MMMKLEIDKRIAIYGSQKEINRSAEIITADLPELPNMIEPQARLALQDLIDLKKIKTDILFDGNTVWSKDRLIRDVKKVVKNGMQSMTDYLYKWLSLQAGSIAHYNKFGWIDVYPTVDHLRQFFLRNEYGKRVKDNLKGRFTDSYLIASEAEQILKI
ncbi:MAG: hypothetical protein ACYC54_14970 [Sedimentisphaerales bacterium]